MCVRVLKCIKGWEGEEGEEEEKKKETTSSTVGRVWEGRLLKTAQMLPHLWPVFQTNLDYFWFFSNDIFAQRCTHTHSPVHYFSLLDEWTDGQRKDRGLRITTGANVTFFGVSFGFWFWVLMNNAAFWDWREGEPHGLGVETRNKCLYVVSYELEAFESLYGVTAKCFWWQKVKKNNKKNQQKNGCNSGTFFSK